MQELGSFLKKPSKLINKRGYFLVETAEELKGEFQNEVTPEEVKDLVTSNMNLTKIFNKRMQF